MNIDRKIRVFLSSKCGGEYTVVRKVLQAMLIESGFCVVYAFETDYSASCPVTSAYLNEVADSDVIIVFIENGDGVADPVQSEINRARELKKKILFFFCDEYEREATVLQRQLKDGLLEKYKLVHEFSDFPVSAYNSFFNDITRVYRHSESKTVADDTGVDITDAYIKSNIKQVKKDSLKNINSVKYMVKKMTGMCIVDDKEYVGLDKAYGDLFSVVIGNNSIDDVDFSELDEFWRKIYSQNLEAVIEDRKKALIKYLSGDYQAAFDILNHVVASYRDILPRWMLNDIAIDMRNIDAYCSNINGQWPFLPKGQDILDADEECIFNPLVDRFNSDFYQELVEYEIKNKVENPDTVYIGRNDRILDYLANTFVAAVNSISITHILLTRTRIIKLFSTLSFQYRVHALYINSIKMLILECDEKELKKYHTKYGESTNLISSGDVNEMQLMVTRIPDEISRVKAQAILLEFFAYYYDDEKFDGVKKCFFDDVQNSIAKGWVSVFSDVIRTLISIDKRVKPGEILDLVYSFMDSDYSRWHNNAIKVIKDINTLSELNEKETKELVHRLNIWLADKEFMNNCPDLLDAVQTVRLSLGDKAKSLDKIVQKYAPAYYKRPYSVNVYRHTPKENSEYILGLISSIKKNNKTQGINGIYSTYAYNDYLTIRNIIQDMVEKPIDYKIISKLFDVIEETLRINTQTCEEKFSALCLLILIQMIYPKNKKVRKILLAIKEFEVIKSSYELSLQNRYTNESLEVIWELAKCFICGTDSDVFITKLYGCTEAEKISILDAICFLTQSKANINNEKLIMTIWPGLLQIEVEESKRMRFFLAVIYSNLYNTSLSDKAINRLIVLLNEGTAPMKIGSISRLKARNASGALVDYIYQQGRVDNHFCVRKVANR